MKKFPRSACLANLTRFRRIWLRYLAAVVSLTPRAARYASNMACRVSARCRAARLCELRINSRHACRLKVP